MREEKQKRRTGVHGAVCREGRVEVRSHKDTALVLAKVLERLCDFLVIEVHVEAAQNGADFRVRRDGGEVHQVDKDVVVGVLQND